MFSTSLERTDLLTIGDPFRNLQPAGCKSAPHWDPHPCAYDSNRVGCDFLPFLGAVHTLHDCSLPDVDLT